MDAVTSATTAKSIEAVNAIMKTANTETIDAAEKMVRVATEMKVGPGSGNGNTIDCFG